MFLFLAFFVDVPVTDLSQIRVRPPTRRLSVLRCGGVLKLFIFTNPPEDKKQNQNSQVDTHRDITPAQLEARVAREGVHHQPERRVPPSLPGELQQPVLQGGCLAFRAATPLLSKFCVHRIL